MQIQINTTESILMQIFTIYICMLFKYIYTLYTNNLKIHTFYYIILFLYVFMYVCMYI